MKPLYAQIHGPAFFWREVKLSADFQWDLRLVLVQGPFFFSE